MLKEIKLRHSTRKFTDQKVSKQTLQKLLRSAMQAPTALNEQPWRFIVVTDKSILQTISKYSKYTGFIAKAPSAIIVYADTKVSRKEFCVVNVGAAIENMLLEAVKLNLGTCWCAIDPIKDTIALYKKYFKLKRTEKPIAIVAVGYKAEEKEFIDRYDDNKVTWL